MKKIESLGFTAIITEDKLQIEISIDDLINGFERNPENYAGETVKQDKKQEFTEYVARELIQGTHMGDSLIMQSVDEVFNEILEGCESFIQYIEDED